MINNNKINCQVLMNYWVEGVDCLDNNMNKRISTIAINILYAAGGQIAGWTFKAQTSSYAIVKLTKAIKGYHQGESIKNEMLNLAGDVTKLTVNYVSETLIIILLDLEQLGKNSLKLCQEVGEGNIYCFVTAMKISVTAVSFYARLFPSVEMIVISVAMKILQDMAYSGKSFYDREWIEGVGHTVCAALRYKNERKNFIFIHRKWTVLTNPKFDRLWQRVQKGRDTEFLKSTPLDNLKKMVQEVADPKFDGLREGVQKGSDTEFLKSTPLDNLKKMVQEVADPKFDRLRERVQKGSDAEILKPTPLDNLKKTVQEVADPKFDELCQHIQKGSDAEFLKSTPFYNLKKTVQENSNHVVVDQKANKTVNLGANFSFFGGGIVKGMVLRFFPRGEDIELNFKVNHVYRKTLQTVLDEYKEYDHEQLNEFLNFAGVAEACSITEVPFVSGEKNGSSEFSVGHACQVDFKGLGKIRVGSRPDVVTLYDRVEVTTPKDRESIDLYMTLSLLGMHDVLRPSTPSQIERLKIGHLFRTFYPSKAIPLERTKEFFSFSLKDLKAHIISLAPSMKKKFKNVLPKMTPVEMLPGAYRFTIPGLANQIKKQGAKALMMGVSGNGEVLAEKLAAICDMGALSSQVRFDSGMNSYGASSVEDYFEGGADSVFTRMITKKFIKEGGNLHHLPFCGSAQVILSLKAIETGTYQYKSDQYGTREMGSYDCPYQNHPSILKLVKTLESSANYPTSNEVMIKEICPPRYITGIMVESGKMATQLKHAMVSRGLVKKNNNGIPCFKNIPLSQFITCGEKIQQKSC